MKAGMRPRTLRVRDVMTKEVLFLNIDHTQEQAWETLHGHEVSGAPVIGARGRLVGVVTKADLADPRRRSPATAGTVGDSMTRLVYAVRADDPAMVAVQLMIEEKIHRVVVVNDDGSLAGIVVPMDVLRAIAAGAELVSPESEAPPVEYVDLTQLA